MEPDEVCTLQRKAVVGGALPDLPEPVSHYCILLFGDQVTNLDLPSVLLLACFGSLGREEH